MKFTRRCWSVGDICKSRFWLSIEPRPFAWWRWYFGTGPTYNGTYAGIVVCTPLFSVIGHLRNVN